MSPRVALLALLLSTPSLAAPLILVHSNDVNGEIEPCGCRNNPLGGMVRKAGLLARTREKNPGVEFLQLDAGNLLFSDLQIPEPLQPQAKVQAQYLLKAHDLLGHDAAVPGTKDLALGLPAFLKLIRASKIHFLAANLLTSPEGKPVLPSSIVIKRGGKRIGIFGLVGNDLPWNPAVQISDPIESARVQVAALKSKSDLIIALTHEGYDADRALAEKVSGIDLIVGGASQTFLQAPQKVGSTRILQSSFRNQYVGLLRLDLGADTPDSYELPGLSQDLEAKSPASMVKLVSEYKKKIAELNSKTQLSLKQISQLVPAGGETKYQTFPRCAECHWKQFDFWRKTPHALAFKSLFEKQQSKNLECQSCHTVGAGDPQGWKAVTELARSKESGKTIDHSEWNSFLQSIHDAKDLQQPVALAGLSAPLHRSVSQLGQAWSPVQCENCHDAGHEHPFSGQIKKGVAQNVCIRCHTSERAPGWYLGGKLNAEVVSAKLKSMTCPRGEMNP